MVQARSLGPAGLEDFSDPPEDDVQRLQVHLHPETSPGPLVSQADFLDVGLCPPLVPLANHLLQVPPRRGPLASPQHGQAWDAPPSPPIGQISAQTGVFSSLCPRRSRSPRVPLSPGRASDADGDVAAGRWTPFNARASRSGLGVAAAEGTQQQPQVEEDTRPARGHLHPEGGPAAVGEGGLQHGRLVAAEDGRLLDRCLVSLSCC